MIEIILIEIIAFVSFLYAVVTMFYAFTSLNKMILLFLWTIAIGTFYGVNKDGSLLYRSSILLLLLPLLYFKGLGPLYFIIITGILVFLYAKTSLLKGSHYDYISKFKRTFLIVMVLIYFKYVFSDLSTSQIGLDNSQIVKGSLSYGSIFIIMYILTSIMLVRLIRHIEFNKDTKKIRRLNFKYLIATGIVLLTTGVEEIRSFLIMAFGKIVDGILMLVFYPMYWITRNIKAPDEPGVVEETILGDGELGIEGLGSEEIGSIMEKQDPIDFTILKRIIGFVLIGVLIYLVYKLLMKTSERQDEGLDYIEEREYMEKSKKKKRSIFENIIYPGDISGQIRYYYRKFLKKIKKEEIQVLDSDTTLDINKKAKDKFGKEIEEIRDIYVKSRYGDKNLDKDSVEKMKNLYKKL